MDNQTKLRNDIHGVVDKIHNTHVLEAVYTLLKQEARHESDILSPFYIPTESEKAAIEEGYAQSKRGEVLSHIQVTERLKKKHNL